MKTYTPPRGHYDLPFTWAFSASGLSTTIPNPNQYVYLQGGYGDFVLRRIVGISRVLAGTAQYQIRDKDGNYIESNPVFGKTADDIGIVPELWYPETGAIKFDLGAVTLPTVPSTAQIAFQGVRRMKGVLPKNPTYKASPKTFTYIMPGATVQPPVGSVVTVRQQVNNYDFELHQIILIAGLPGTFEIVNEISNGIEFISVNPSIPVILDIPTPTGAQPLSVTVVGTTVTINWESAGAGWGSTTTTSGQIIALLASTPAAAALLTGAVIGTEGGINPERSYSNIILQGSFGPSGGLTSLWLYDSNKVQVSNKPLYDAYMDGIPSSDTGLYKNGALVPPLWYPKDTQIQMDVYSNLTSGSATLYIYLIGKQWFPC